MESQRQKQNQKQAQEQTQTQEQTEQIHKFPNHSVWKEKLQEAPNEKWIETRDLGKGKTSRFLPLGIQEALADLFFREIDIIDIDVEINGTQILSQVKMSVLPDFPNAEHRIISGVGARVMTKAGNSLEYGARSAKNAAKSEAFTDFGNIFGRNLNRKFVDNFSYSGKKTKKE